MNKSIQKLSRKPPTSSWHPYTLRSGTLACHGDTRCTARASSSPCRGGTSSPCAVAFSLAVRAPGLALWAGVFPLAVGAGLALRTVLFHLAVRAGVTVRALAFHLPVGTPFALHAVPLHLVVRAKVARRAAVFHLAVGTPVALNAVLFQLAVRAAVALRALGFHPVMQAPLFSHGAKQMSLSRRPRASLTSSPTRSHL